MVIETLGIESFAAENLVSETLAVGNRDKDILQRGNLFLLCTDGNLGCQLRAAKGVTAWRTWAQGYWGTEGKFPQTANYCSCGICG